MKQKYVVGYVINENRFFKKTNDSSEENDCRFFQPLLY